MSNVTGHDQGAGERESCFDRILRERLQDFFDRSVQVDLEKAPKQGKPARLNLDEQKVLKAHLDHIAPQMLWQDFRQILSWICFQLFQKDSILVDLANDLTIGRTRDAHAN